MNSVERIRKICKDRDIPLSRIERECGFGNGYLGSKKGDLPPLRLKAVADYLGVTADFLTYGEGHYIVDETAQIAQQIHDNQDLRALFSAAKDADPQTLKDIHEMLLIMKRRERGDTE